jgi:nucleotide-binding universal stress UspA family protein
MMTVSRILVPVDFSEHSARALDCAKTLAEKFGASLHVLTVVSDPLVLPDPGPWYVPLPEGYLDGLRQDAESRLRGLLTAAEQRQFRAESSVTTGDPYREILEFVKRSSIDLIVMGTHGRGGVAHALMGSVAEKVVRTATCPVLTVR